MLPYRITGPARRGIERILIESGRDFGEAAAERYHRLMLGVFDALGTEPNRRGSRALDDLPDVRAFPLRLGTQLVERDLRVRTPRHIVVYRIGSDGVVEILGLAHDRMLLDRFARSVQRQTRS